MMNSNNSDVPEFILNKSKKELEFLTVYSKIGDSLEKSIRSLTSKLKDWPAKTNSLLDIDNFVKIEARYIHYKQKLAKLIQDIEEKRAKNKKTSSSELKRVKRVGVSYLSLNPRTSSSSAPRKT